MYVMELGLPICEIVIKDTYIYQKVGYKSCGKCPLTNTRQNQKLSITDLPRNTAMNLLTIKICVFETKNKGMVTGDYINSVSLEPSAHLKII